MLSFTDKVMRRFKSMLKQSPNGEHGVRIYTEAGCCMPTLSMGIVEGAEKGDVIIEYDGVKIFLEKKANKMLSGATMDYSPREGIIVSGIIRPSSSCC